ncbi:MAG: 23S rRNA (guanosine(2251)-2'-O)-methyltransferase RlmB [Candidatus Aminicenantes bacterium]|nr:23S rRNA (guanosine(2251)-2'-O)-methyltransferase RlmB [Candidatus Aminicenantes bacterium]
MTSRINPLLEVLRSTPRRVNKILLQKEGGRRPVGEIVALAKAGHVPYLFVPKQALDKLSAYHQGVVATLAPKEFSSLEAIMEEAKNPFLVLLDEVEDPQNLGAILRSAEGAGADGVILPERRSAGLTESVYEVSAGALEYLKVARVPNLAQTMDGLKKRGIWLVGAESGGEGEYYEFDYAQPVGLVFGSEGRGLRPLVRKKCDKILSIPLRGKVNSLNVASAASIFLFEVVRQRSET